MADKPLATVDWHDHCEALRAKQAKAIALLRELEKDWEPTQFEQQIDGNFHGSEECAVCGKRWREEGTHECDREKMIAALLRERGEYAEAQAAWEKGRQLGFDVVSEGHKRWEELTKSIKDLE